MLCWCSDSGYESLVIYTAADQHRSPWRLAVLVILLLRSRVDALLGHSSLSVNGKTDFKKRSLRRVSCNYRSLRFTRETRHYSAFFQSRRMCFSCIARLSGNDEESSTEELLSNDETTLIPRAQYSNHNIR